MEPMSLVAWFVDSYSFKMDVVDLDSLSFVKVLLVLGCEERLLMSESAVHGFKAWHFMVSGFVFDFRQEPSL